MTQEDVYQALTISRYAPHEYLLFQEVFYKERRIDLYAINQWRSRGHTAHGIEIKVSRSDWLRELKNPKKADDVFEVCDFWWLAAPKGVVKDLDEIPKGWGFIEVYPTRTVVRVKAEGRASIFSRSLFVTMARQTLNRRNQLIDSIVEQQLQQRKREMAEQQAALSEERDRLHREADARFRESLGTDAKIFDTFLRLSRKHGLHWMSEEMMEKNLDAALTVVRDIRSSEKRLENTLSDVERMKSTLAHIATQIDTVKESLHTLKQSGE